MAVFICYRTGNSGSYFEHGNEVSDSVKDGEFLQ
jgi:hypothetical protein